MKKISVLIISFLMLISCESLVTVKNPLLDYTQVYKNSSAFTWQQGENISLEVGENIQLGIKNIRRNTIITPKWSINNNLVGELDVNGIFKAKQQGATTVTAKIGNTLIKTYAITVIEKTLPSSLPISQLPTPTPTPGGGNVPTPTPVPGGGNPSSSLPSSPSSPSSEDTSSPNMCISLTYPGNGALLTANATLRAQITQCGLRVQILEENNSLPPGSPPPVNPDVRISFYYKKTLNGEPVLIREGFNLYETEWRTNEVSNGDYYLFARTNYGIESPSVQVTVQNDCCPPPPCLTGYKQKITITNAGGLLTDYQVNVNKNNTDAHFWSNVNTKDDIRFFADDDITPLNYWVEKFDTGTKTANLWVKVPNIPASGTKNIYLYYGKITSPSTETFDNTFTKDYDPDATLVGLWHLDENGDKGDVIDSTGNGNGKNESHTGTLMGAGTPAWSNGDIGKGNALDFNEGDANSYVQVTNTESIKQIADAVNNCTIEAWIFRNNNTQWNTIMSTNTAFRFCIIPDSGNALKWSWWDGGGVLSEIYSPFTLDGTWAHVVGVKDYNAGTGQTTLGFYINGVEQAGANCPLSFNPLATNVINLFAIGKNKIGGWGDDMFDGKIDEVRLYNRKLSSAEINDRYTNNTNIRDGLIGEWRFEENGGAKAY